ncbi:MAG TPA: DNA polymerase I [Candidatus Baltobacteraceae bacterium]|jgi:DNA polymerase-1|nr:DNA polymerase I [Candidatus Baltobacteraceae bacterium]
MTPAADIRVMLIDTYGLVYRAFFALPAMSTAKGVPTNAAYGFVQMLTKLLAEEKPTHVIACFDKGLPKARVALYSAYKAQRDAMPDNLRPQFALVRRILATYHIPVVEQEGEEADDVIATLAARIGEEGGRSEVVTGDLDLLQIVDKRTTVLATRRGITDLGRYDVAAVRERFELEPGQLPDYRGLKGDPSDNLPGIPGIGEKTAIKLIRAAGSLDALLADPTLAGSPKLEKLVREHGEQARICREVSVIKRDLALEIAWEKARYAAPSGEELAALYRELEFKTLLARVAATMPIATSTPSVLEQPSLIEVAPSLDGAYRSFTASTDPPDFALLAKEIRAATSSPCVALVTNVEHELGLSARVGEGLSFSAGAFEDARVREAFSALLTGASRLIAHDAKGLLALLRGRFSSDAKFTDDTKLLAHLIDPSRSFIELGDITARFLDRTLGSDVAARADAVQRLVPALRAQLAERGQLDLYETVELPLVAVLARMEARGIVVDVGILAELASEGEATINRLQAEIHDLAGETFNIGSPQKLGVILFERLGLPGGTKNKTGWATGVEVLQVLARTYPICAKVMEYREVTKLQNTYIEVLPRMVGADRRLHTEFHQTTTATGRVSSTNPNLQNIPVRTELGRRIRRAFVVPDAEHVLLAADYSQIELRLMAHLSGDEAMRSAFLRGEDIHDFTARGLFHLGAGERPDANHRRIAKSVNFGLLYGMSDFGLAQRLEIGRGEAHEIVEAYFARFPSVRAYIASILESGRKHGYVETILGRRRYMPDLLSRNHGLRAAAEREATNAPLQGSAADLMKLAMVRIDRSLRDRSDVAMLLQIHDELIFEVRRNVVREIARIVKTEMEGAYPLSVPLEVTVKVGSSWYDLESFNMEPIVVS